MLFHALRKQNRVLLRELVVTDFKLRYQGSVLGYLWSLLRPLFLFAILYVVFGKFLKLGSSIEHYPIYLLLGIVLWGYFTETTSNGLASIVSRGDLLRKINFPKYIVVISGTISALVNLCLNLIVVGFFMAITGLRPSLTWLWFPLVILELYVVSLSLAFLLSTAFVKYRDIGYIWEVILQAGFYATPVLYPISLIANQHLVAAKILMLSPLAQSIQDARYSLVTHQTTRMFDLIHNPFLRLMPFAIIFLAVALGVYFFKTQSARFAEDI